MPKSYNVYLNGRKIALSEQQIVSLIKHFLKQSKFIKKMFDLFDISIDQLDNLIIKIMPLEKQYALTDDRVMKLNEKLFTEHNDFFQKYMFVPVHEIVHYLTRKKEKEAYFNDPEEVMGFIAGIAYYLEKGKKNQEIWRIIYPHISWHFNDKRDAEAFFKRCLKKAREWLFKGEKE